MDTIKSATCDVVVQKMRDRILRDEKLSRFDHELRSWPNWSLPSVREVAQVAEVATGTLLSIDPPKGEDFREREKRTETYGSSSFNLRTEGIQLQLNELDIITSSSRSS